MSRLTNSINPVRPSLDTTAHPYLEEARQVWLSGLDRIGGELRGRHLPTIEEGILALESLPLTTEEFATARLRLANLRNYARIGEWGAAEFEFRLLSVVGQ